MFCWSLKNPAVALPDPQFVQLFSNPGLPAVPMSRNASAGVSVCAVWAFTALVAFVALVALVAFVALSALVAWSALAADGTLPRLDSLTSAPVTWSFLIFGLVTALFFSCLVPTLFRGSAFAAANVVPPSAMN